MNLHLSDSETFLDAYILPLSRVTDSGSLKLETDKVSCLVATGDGTIIVYGEYREAISGITEPITLNVPDIKKLHKLLSLINTKSIDLTIDSNSNNNNIAYSSDDMRFKYHLYENGVMKAPTLNMSKLKTINFDGNFTVSNERLSALLKGSTLTPDINKFYISFKGGRVYAEITDQAQQNVDSYSTYISTDYSGVPITASIPINFEIIRLLSSSKIGQFSVKLASKLNVFNFEVVSEKVTLNYIVSALIK
jgi:hypothetical protein